MISILGGSPKYPHSCYTANEWKKLKEAFTKLSQEIDDTDVPLFKYDVKRMIDYCTKKEKERAEQYGYEQAN